MPAADLGGGGIQTRLGAAAVADSLSFLSDKNSSDSQGQKYEQRNDLLRTGALAGLVAGGISAAAYALHCPDDSLPFVALWFGGTIVSLYFSRVG
jgi:hypothetical protein